MKRKVQQEIESLCWKCVEKAMSMKTGGKLFSEFKEKREDRKLSIPIF